ncbi:hypothetical protein RFI_22145 [Reticulomyxa filosa]|uniref:Uncharacterized protein n=1 Tax=Reticulomyxa filosa TaxID=46433 RepID=X6MMX5_RETFI|nr:hypothetical protein RFI_22145 [Reticulomyxa filosa]|eukprot:ETO15219.1 hypothetical protein RFI_22145 [Reticulomyxa filosa]
MEILFEVIVSFFPFILATLYSFNLIKQKKNHLITSLESQKKKITIFYENEKEVGIQSYLIKNIEKVSQEDKLVTKKFRSDNYRYNKTVSVNNSLKVSGLDNFNLAKLNPLVSHKINFYSLKKLILTIQSFFYLYNSKTKDKMRNFVLFKKDIQKNLQPKIIDETTMLKKFVYCVAKKSCLNKKKDLELSRNHLR